MKKVESTPDGKWLVSDERVDNDILLWICEYGSINQLDIILKERTEKKHKSA
jgi:hypothetical protein